MPILQSFNKKKVLLFFSYLMVTTFGCNNSYARDYQHDKILINNPYSTPTRPGTSNGVMYIENIKNTSEIEDELIGVSTSITDLCEIHSMKNINGMMKMRKITSIKLPPDEIVSIKRGNKNGYHIMLFKVQKKLGDGDSFSAMLHFKNAETLKVNVEVTESSNAHIH